MKNIILLSLNLIRLLAVSVCLLTSVSAIATPVYFNDFDGGESTDLGITASFSGVTTTESVQGYVGLGTGSNLFGGKFLYNDSGSAGVSPTATTLMLTDLPTHTSVDINFLLGIIDSWDGEGNILYSPDFFGVKVDGVMLFFESFGFNDVSYLPPPGVELASFTPLGFNGSFGDAAYDMGLDSIFSGISHTGSSLTIEWFAAGSGWQGGDDESWAIENVEIILNGVAIPEPATLALLALGLAGLGFKRRKAS